MTTTKKIVMFAIALNKKDSTESTYEIKWSEDESKHINKMVGGHFRLQATNIRNGWVCYVNDERNDFPEINYPLQILLRYLNPDIIRPAFGNGVLVFSNPHKHTRLLTAIRQWMQLYDKVGVASPETIAREDATDTYWESHQSMRHCLSTTKFFDFLKHPDMTALQFADQDEESEMCGEIDDKVYFPDVSSESPQNKKQKNVA